MVASRLERYTRAAGSHFAARRQPRLLLVCIVHGLPPARALSDALCLPVQKVAQLERGLAAVALIHALLEACPLQSYSIGIAMALFPTCQEIEEKSPVRDDAHA